MRISKIKPLFNHVVTTMDKEITDQKTKGGLIDVTKKAGTIKEIQRVIAVGDTVRSIKEGQFVKINPSRYLKTRNSLKDEVNNTKLEVSVEFPVVTLGDTDYLFLYDSDIDYIVEKFEPEIASNVTELLN